MSISIFLLIVGMGLATYLPRMLPFWLMKEGALPPFWMRVLENIPYATLGALIFPGVLYIQENIWAGLVGGLSAVIIALLGANVIVVVLGSIAVLAGLSLYM
ncbi:AzlD domain-containing protein [Gracilibacillus sp. Marseille-QA3620]